MDLDGAITLVLLGRCSSIRFPSPLLMNFTSYCPSCPRGASDPLCVLLTGHQVPPSHA